MIPWGSSSHVALLEEFLAPEEERDEGKRGEDARDDGGRGEDVLRRWVVADGDRGGAREGLVRAPDGVDDENARAPFDGSGTYAGGTRSEREWRGDAVPGRSLRVCLLGDER